MKTPTKEQLLLAADAKAIAHILADCWSTLHDEEQKEHCLEKIYELIEATAPYPPEFSILSQDQKAQYEIDIDMVIITIDFKDIGKYILKEEHNSRYFWEKISKTEKNEEIFQKIF